MQRYEKGVRRLIGSCALPSTTLHCRSSVVVQALVFPEIAAKASYSRTLTLVVLDQVYGRSPPYKVVSSPFHLSIPVAGLLQAFAQSLHYTSSR
jgi:hypothetical protein